MSDWRNVIEYINNRSITFNCVGLKYDIERDTDTVSLYVNYLHKAGFIKRVSRGMYKRIHEIPSDLTLTQLKKFAYKEGLTWEQRKMVVERYWKLQNLKRKMIEKSK